MNAILLIILKYWITAGAILMCRVLFARWYAISLKEEKRETQKKLKYTTRILCKLLAINVASLIIYNTISVFSQLTEGEFAEVRSYNPYCIFIMLFAIVYLGLLFFFKPEKYEKFFYKLEIV